MLHAETILQQYLLNLIIHAIFPDHQRNSLTFQVGGEPGTVAVASNRVH